ncbi:uncharacterized protein LOC128241538 [Mya arenaria]|uniref:uncharacterized protein LOC128241538 n=1 Tax=Mya arenaria TaxID=6604 RepID=UPI0022E792BC|nr:uncharacterized protein LOC128241538 [Mya arenaria]
MGVNTTMANSVLKTMQQILTCSICMDIFKDPRLLSCQHTLCQKCLTSCIKKTRKKGRSKSMFRCPMCRHEVMIDKLDPSTYTFTKNMTMQHFLDEFEEDINDVIDNQNETPKREYGTQTDVNEHLVTRNAATQTFPTNSKQLSGNKSTNVLSVNNPLPFLEIDPFKALAKKIWAIVSAVIKVCCLPFRLLFYLLKMLCFAPALFLFRLLRLPFDLLKSGLEGSGRNSHRNVGEIQDGNNETTANNELQELPKRVIIIGIILYFVSSTLLYLLFLAYAFGMFCILVLGLAFVQQTHKLPVKRRRGRLMASKVRLQTRFVY